MLLMDFMNNKTAKKLILLSFLLLFTLMLAFNLMTPMAGDDYAHYYGEFGTHPTSLREIVENLISFRQTTNGRVISHFFVYLFLVPPRILFSIINTCNTVFLVWLMTRYFGVENDKINLVLLFLSLFLVWCFMPGFGEVFLWYTGSINYSWGLTLFLLYIYPFYCLFLGKKSYFPAVPLCLLGLICGAYSENGSIATVFVTAAFLAASKIIGRKIDKKFVISVILSIIGFVFLMTAPSEIGTRAGEFSYSAIFQAARNCVILSGKYCWGLFLLYFILFPFALRKKTDIKVLTSSLIFLCGALGSVAVFAFAVYIPRRSFYIMTMFLTIADLLLLSNVWNLCPKKVISALFLALALLFAWRFVYGTYDITKLYLQSRNRTAIISEAKASGNLNVSLPEYTTGTSYSEISQEEMEESPDWWYNNLLAKYYGLESVTGILNR